MPANDLPDVTVTLNREDAERFLGAVEDAIGVVRSAKGLDRDRKIEMVGDLVWVHEVVTLAMFGGYLPDQGDEP